MAAGGRNGPVQFGPLRLDQKSMSVMRRKKQNKNPVSVGAAVELSAIMQKNRQGTRE